MSSDEITLQGYGGHLAAKRWRGGGTKRILALHGWLDNAGTYDGLAPLLENTDLVCLDLPGHGLSYHRPPGIPYHFVDWVPEVFSAADCLEWDRFVLMGHSMGAGIAALAAGTFADRVEKLILIEGIGPFASPDEEAPGLLKKALLHKPSDKKQYYRSREEAVQRLCKRDLEEHSARALAERALTEGENGWYFHYAPEARAPSRQRLSETQVRAFLKEITCPTLLIQATQGLEIPEPYSARENFVPNLTKVEVEGRHHVHLDHPERVAQLVRGFL
jgi:pimeloyl-ACP methyl ester carboxylesterase